MPATTDEWLAAVEASERDLATAVLAFVRETLGETEETVKWGQPCFVDGGSNCLYVSAQDGYVNLGFYEGAALDDPAELLEGTGQAMRHVKVDSVGTLRDPDLAALVEAAAALARD